MKPDRRDVSFDDAISAFARIAIEHLGEHALDTHRFIRDIDGRLSLLLLDDAAAKDSIERLRSAAKGALGFFAGFEVIESRGDLLDPSLATDFTIGEKVNLAESGPASWRRVAVVDRRIVGQDWVNEPNGPPPGAPPILTFHGVKGGVGRSTALAVAACAQATQGRNVLVVDLDLEAPGLASLLLEPGERPEFGVIDWLVTTNVGGDEASLASVCIAESRLTAGRGSIDVLPALGNAGAGTPWGVVPKLGRALVDHPDSGEPFLNRIRKLIELACATGPRHYDAVMVDARAGLAESTAAALIGLGAHNLCFGIDAQATYEGYRYLFSYLSGIARASDDKPHWCTNFHIVHAKAQPGSGARRAFREQTYEVFVEHVYDADASGMSTSDKLFSFDYDDEDAPHWPWPIGFDATFAEIDPSQDSDRLAGEFADRAFGSFVARIDRLISDTRKGG